MFTLQQLASDPDRLMILATYPDLTVGQLFDHFTIPTLLKNWWPQAVEIEPRQGGLYHFSWPDMNWHLRGTLSAFEPERRLTYSWQWDHEPFTPERCVDILFSPKDGGSRLVLTHGFYEPEAGRERMEHLDGWLYFLPLIGAQ